MNRFVNKDLEAQNVALTPANLPKLDKVQKKLAEKSLRHFMRQAWSTVEPGSTFIPGWHIDAICEHLDAVARGQIKKLIINIPPRHCKSLTVSVFWPAQIWTWRPATRFIFGSHDQRLSTRDNLKTRRLITSDWYQERWGDKVHLDEFQAQKQYFELESTGARLATSVGSGITGEGGDILVADDPHNVLQALASDKLRQEAIDWWTTTMSSRLNPGSAIGARVIIMQRIHERDLTGYLLDKDPGYEVLCLPAEYESNHPVPCKTSLNFQDPRENPGELLWEAGMPQERIHSLKKDLGSYAASGQLQQRPSPEGGGLIKKTWFTLLSRADWPTSFDEVAQAWDLSVDDDPEADFTVGWVIGRIGVRLYGIARIRRQCGFNAQIELMKALTIMHPEASAKYVEKAGHASALEQTLNAQIPGIILVPPLDSKLKKVLAWTPYAEAGNFFLPADAPWVEEFLTECEQVPNGAYDDQVDAWGLGALQLIHRGSDLVLPADTSVDKRSTWR